MDLAELLFSSAKDVRASPYYDVLMDLSDLKPVISDANARHKKTRKSFCVLASQASEGIAHVPAASVDPASVGMGAGSSADGQLQGGPSLEVRKVIFTEDFESGANRRADKVRIPEANRAEAAAGDIKGQRKTRRETRRMATLMQVGVVRGRARRTSPSRERSTPAPLSRGRSVTRARGSRRDADELTLPLLGESVRRRPQGSDSRTRRVPDRAASSAGYGPPTLRGSIVTHQ